MADIPRIYVACLASYNRGVLHGEWIEIDVDKSADDVREDVKHILPRSPVSGVEGHLTVEQGREFHVFHSH
jgi:hypothetical protein